MRVTRLNHLPLRFGSVNCENAVNRRAYCTNQHSLVSFLPVEIPLSLKKHKDGRISYGFPLWFRILDLAIIALIVGSIFVSELAPGVMAWVLVALLAVGSLFEERWTVRPDQRCIEHRVGVFPVLRKTSISFDSIVRFSIDMFARGTIPGSEDEAAVKQRGFSMLYDKQPTEDVGRVARPSTYKKPYATLLIVTKDDATYLVDTQPAKRATHLLEAGTQLAKACGFVLQEQENKQ